MVGVNGIAHIQLTVRDPDRCLPGFTVSELDATIIHGPEEGSRFAPGYYSGSDNMRMRGALRFTSPPCDNTGSRFQHAGSPLELPGHSVVGWSFAINSRFAWPST